MKNTLYTLVILLTLLIISPIQKAYALTITDYPSIVFEGGTKIYLYDQYTQSSGITSQIRVIDIVSHNGLEITQDSAANREGGIRYYLNIKAPYTLNYYTGPIGSNPLTKQVMTNSTVGSQTSMTFTSLVSSNTSLNNSDGSSFYEYIKPYPTQNELSLGTYENGLYIYSPRDNEVMMDNTIYKFKANFKYDLPITMNNYTISDNDRIFINNALDSQVLNTLEVFFTDSEGNVYPSTTSNITINQSDYLRPMVTNEYIDPPMSGILEGYIRSPYNIGTDYTLHARIRPYSSINFKNGQLGANNISIIDSNVQVLETEIAINVMVQSQITDANSDLIEDNTNDIILPPVTNIIINNNNSNGDGYTPTPIIVPEVPTINNTNVSLILDGLTNFFGENGFFTSIAAFYGELLSWLPIEVRLVLGGATTLVAILLIVKVIRG